jgi:hypothetical protein
MSQSVCVRKIKIYLCGTPYVLFSLASCYTFDGGASNFLHILFKSKSINVLEYLISVVGGERLAHALDERRVSFQGRIEFG